MFRAAVRGCRGDRPLLIVDTDPYVCLHLSYDYYNGTVLYVRTCVTPEAGMVYEIPIERIGRAVLDLVEDPEYVLGRVC